MKKHLLVLLQLSHLLQAQKALAIISVNKVHGNYDQGTLIGQNKRPAPTASTEGMPLSVSSQNPKYATIA